MRLAAQLFVAFLTNAALSQNVTLINNHAFEICMPLEVRNVPADGPMLTSSGELAQPVGTNLVVIARVGPAAQKTLNFAQGTAKIESILNLTTNANGVSIIYQGRNVGELGWDIVVHPAKRQRGDAERPESTKADFDAEFKALPLSVRQTATGPVFNEWVAAGKKEGLELELRLRAFHQGFLDISATLRNKSAARATNVYAAVVCRWQQPGAKARSLCYDNHIGVFEFKAWSPFRSSDGRHAFIQRGVDWVRTAFDGGLNAAWLYDFAPSFTVEASATAKTPARYTGANASQLGQEVQSANASLYSITEIARSSLRGFRDRLKENILPPPGESVSFNSRIVFGDSNLDDKRSDQSFVAWTSFIQQTPISSDKPTSKKLPGITVTFGASAVRFGTSYFPYSTLGENFDQFKLPGMDRESFWPLAADTVKQWKLFADEIRRDLRIAKAMGFQLIRLHHLELLAPIEKIVRQEYLDFLFAELRHLKLKALLDVYASPEQLRELVTRYRDVVDSVEIENEVLIWGIPMDRAEYWKDAYAAIKKAAPEIEVHFTGYNNTGMFDRLQKLGVPFDRVCLHSYIDTPDAIPSGRGYSLALSSYGSKAGKAPLITEWNWRGLTRMPPLERAKIYPGIIESAIGTHGITDFYQFQFNETLCPNPRLGRGNILRHYELLHLSRRPKAEALSLMELIRKYSAPIDSLRRLDVTFPIVRLDARGKGVAELRLNNTGTNALRVSLELESDRELQADPGFENTTTLAPGKEQIFKIELSITNRYPGFYYAFVRIESDDGLLRYAVIETQRVGAPKFAADEFNLDWTRSCTVVYGKDAPVLEVETAIAIAETLESAIGQPVEALQESDLPTYAQNENLLLVGTPESNKRIKLLPIARMDGTNGFAGIVRGPAGRDLLVVTGTDSRAVETAGMKFILSYWKNAKDSAARRVGLVEKELPRGGDATRLP